MIYERTQYDLSKAEKTEKMDNKSSPDKDYNLSDLEQN